MSVKYYKNVETEEVVSVEEGAEDVYKDVMIDNTSNRLYREVSAVEAGAYVEPVDVVNESSVPPVDE